MPSSLSYSGSPRAAHRAGGLGAGLEAQLAAITAEVERRGWELVRIYEDAGASGKTLKRPGLTDALEAIERGEASALVVSKLDRLSRSVVDFAGLVARAQRRGWALVALDLGLDMTTPAGGLVANVMASVAEWERRVIWERTAAALAARRAAGVRLGRPREIPPAVVARIREPASDGESVAGIARRLNEERVPTPRGGRWHSPGVSRVLSWSEAARDRLPIPST